MSNQNFIDYVKILFRSGKGGAGSRHYYRDRRNPKGGPDGGDGGRGGNIVLRGNPQLWTLLPLRYTKHVFAEDGAPGGANQRTGANGRDVIIDVPLGTVAKDAETGQVLGEILEGGQELILLKGGLGGRGNVHFKSAVNQTPRYAQPGREGKEKWIVLELKVLADVGLVGFPNAGKSTLLAAVSAAKPKIADYPFTTLVPNLGIVPYRDNRSFVMADIPGIIEGAHEGKGLGSRFLRHIERNSVLVYVVPADAEQIPEQFDILRKELSAYSPELADKPALYVISKADLLDGELKEMIRRELPRDLDARYISAVSGEGILSLKDRIWSVLSLQT